jgi:rRNA maturation RNase YbeY
MVRHKVSLSLDDDVVCLNNVLYKKYALKALKYVCNDKKTFEMSELKSYKDYCFNLDILICKDDKIKQLNKDFRNKNKPTDVLTFALFADNPEVRTVVDGNIFLGEIIISAETAKQQAEQANKSLDDEILFLISHGILHLFGFTHDDEESYDFMMETQNRMLVAD